MPGFPIFCKPLYRKGMPPVSQKLHIPASQAGKVEAFYTEHFDEL